MRASMHRATLAAVVAARYFTFRSSLFLYLVQISSRRSSQSVFCAPYFIVVCNTLEVGGVKHNKVHIGLLTLFSSESNLPAFFSIRLVSSRFLADLDPAGYLDRLSALGDLAKTSGRVKLNLRLRYSRYSRWDARRVLFPAGFNDTQTQRPFSQLYFQCTRNHTRW